MKLLNQSQLTNRISAVIKGQKFVDCVNALIVNTASLFESCDNVLMQISIAGTLRSLSDRFTSILVAKKAFSFDGELAKFLEDLIVNGPTNSVGYNAVDVEHLVKAGMVVNVVCQQKASFVAATYHAHKWFIACYHASSLEEAIAKRNAGGTNEVQS